MSRKSLKWPKNGRKSTCLGVERGKNLFLGTLALECLGTQNWRKKIKIFFQKQKKRSEIKIVAQLRCFFVRIKKFIFFDDKKRVIKTRARHIFRENPADYPKLSFLKIKNFLCLFNRAVHLEKIHFNCVNLWRLKILYFLFLIKNS